MAAGEDLFDLRLEPTDLDPHFGSILVFIPLVCDRATCWSLRQGLEIGYYPPLSIFAFKFEFHEETVFVWVNLEKGS